jgi:PAS domain-containing protein
MKKTTNTITKKPNSPPITDSFIEKYWDQSWTYIKTVIDVVREPVLVLDSDFRVLSANIPFYHTFKVKPKETEGKIVYELGNNQWKIPALKKLLESMLPKQTFFRGFEVVHDFPSIGKKVMLLNGRQIYVQGEFVNKPIILLAIEDITEVVGAADKLAEHTKEFEIKLAEREEKLSSLVKDLEKEIIDLKKNS